MSNSYFRWGLLWFALEVIAFVNYFTVGGDHSKYMATICGIACGFNMFMYLKETKDVVERLFVLSICIKPLAGKDHKFITIYKGHSVWVTTMLLRMFRWHPHMELNTYIPRMAESNG